MYPLRLIQLPYLFCTTVIPTSLNSASNTLFASLSMIAWVNFAIYSGCCGEASHGHFIGNSKFTAKITGYANWVDELNVIAVVGCFFVFMITV